MGEAHQARVAQDSVLIIRASRTNDHERIATGENPLMKYSPQRIRARLRLTGLASLSLGVAFILGWLLPADHPVWRLALGVFSLLLAAVNLSLLRPRV